MPIMRTGLGVATILYLADAIRATPLDIRDGGKEGWTIGPRMHHATSRRLRETLKLIDFRMFHLYSDSKIGQQYGKSVRIHEMRRQARLERD